MDGDFEAHINELMKIAGPLREQGCSQAQVCAAMRSGGASRAEGVMVVGKLYSVSLREAQEIVTASEAWLDQHASDAKLQNWFLSAFELLADSEKSENNPK